MNPFQKAKFRMSRKKECRTIFKNFVVFLRNFFCKHISINTFDFFFSEWICMRTCLPCVILYRMRLTPIQLKTRHDWINLRFYLQNWGVFSIDLITNYRQNIDLKRHSCYSVSFTFFCVWLFEYRFFFIPSLIRLNETHSTAAMCTAYGCTCVCDEYLFSIAKGVWRQCASVNNNTMCVIRCAGKNVQHSQYCFVV